MALGSEFRGTLTGLGMVVAAVLVAISVSFGIPGQELLQSLRFHIVLAALPLVALLALSGARLRSLVLLGLLALSAAEGGAVVYGQLQRRSPPTEIGASLSLLSFNVLFDNAQNQRVIDYLLGDPPDIAVILEARGIRDKLDALRATYPTAIGCDPTEQCEAVILSRLPVLQSRVYAFPPFRQQRLVTALVELNGVKVTIVAIHLTKPYFDAASIGELEMLRSILSYQSGPLVLAGDFNAAPWSRAVASAVADTQLAPAPAFPATWPIELGAFGVPIDNMFSRGGAFIRTIESLPDAMASNHRALRATIDIAAAP